MFSLCIFSGAFDALMTEVTAYVLNASAPICNQLQAIVQPSSLYSPSVVPFHTSSGCYESANFCLQPARIMGPMLQPGVVQAGHVSEAGSTQLLEAAVRDQASSHAVDVSSLPANILLKLHTLSVPGMVGGPFQHHQQPDSGRPVVVGDCAGQETPTSAESGTEKDNTISTLLPSASVELPAGHSAAKQAAAVFGKLVKLGPRFTCSQTGDGGDEWVDCFPSSSSSTSDPWGCSVSNVMYATDTSSPSNGPVVGSMSYRCQTDSSCLAARSPQQIGSRDQFPGKDEFVDAGLTCYEMKVASLQTDLSCCPVSAHRLSDMDVLNHTKSAHIQDNCLHGGMHDSEYHVENGPEWITIPIAVESVRNCQRLTGEAGGKPVGGVINAGRLLQQEAGVTAEDHHVAVKRAVTLDGGGDGKQQLFPCQECGAKFVWARNLSRHMRKHTGQRPYACNECPATFTQNSHLKVHMLKHSGERPYVCSYCSATFTRSSYLNRHTLKHVGQSPCAPRPLQDAASGQSSGTTVNSKSLQLLSNSQLLVKKPSLSKRSSTCSIGDSSCDTSTHGSASDGRDGVVDVKGHFTCSQCTAVLPYFSQLQSHMQRHLAQQQYDFHDDDFDEDMRRFSCNHCSVSFTRLSQLRRHSLDTGNGGCSRSNDMAANVTQGTAVGGCGTPPGAGELSRSSMLHGELNTHGTVAGNVTLLSDLMLGEVTGGRITDTTTDGVTRQPVFMDALCQT